MLEEILAFYPILMPIFLKSGMDGLLSTASLYLGSVIGKLSMIQYFIMETILIYYME